MPKSSDRVGWLLPGQMLLVNKQILPIQDCQIVLSRRASSCHAKLEQDDCVPTVEFWFNRPIQGASAYVPVIKTGKVVLTQVTQIEQVQDWKDVQWLVIVSGDAAISVRRLILQLAKQNTSNSPLPKQTSSKPPVPKPSPPITDTPRYQIIVKNQPKPERANLNVLDFLDLDGFDSENEES